MQKIGSSQNMPVNRPSGINLHDGARLDRMQDDVKGS